MDMSPAERKSMRERAASAVRNSMVGGKQSAMAAVVGGVIAGVKAGINRFIKPTNSMRAIAKGVAGVGAMVGGHFLARESPGAGFGAVGAGAVVAGDALEEKFLGYPTDGGPSANGSNGQQNFAADASAPPDAGAVRRLAQVYGPPRYARIPDAGAVRRVPQAPQAPARTSPITTARPPRRG